MQGQKKGGHKVEIGGYVYNTQYSRGASLGAPPENF